VFPLTLEKYVSMRPSRRSL